MGLKCSLDSPSNVQGDVTTNLFNLATSEPNNVFFSGVGNISYPQPRWGPVVQSFRPTYFKFFNSRIFLKTSWRSNKFIFKAPVISNIFRLAFHWLLPLLRLGYHVPLEETDLAPLPHEEQVKQIFLNLKEKLKTRNGLIRKCVGLNKGLLLTGAFFR